MFRIVYLLILLFLFAFIYRKYKTFPKFLFFALIFSSTLRLGYILYRYNGVLLLDVPLIILLVLEINQYKQFKLFVPKVGILFLVFIGWAFVVSLSLNWMQANSFAEISKWVRAYLIIIVVYNFIVWKKDLNLFLDSLFVTVLYHGLVSIYQWRVGPIGLSMLGEMRIYSFRSYGLFQHPNFLADYLAFVIPLFIRLFYFDRSKRKVYAYTSILGIAVLSLFTTYSRGAWIGLFVAVGLMLIIDIFTMNFRKIKSFSLILSVVFATAFLVRYLPKIQERFLSDMEMEGGSAEIRIPLMKIAFAMIKDRPIFGVGFSNYELYAMDYAYDVGVFSKKSMSQIVHNSYLLMAGEIGIPGLIIYLMLVAQIFLAAFKNYFSKVEKIKNVSTGIGWGIFGILLAFFVGPDYMIHEVLNTFWLLGAVVLAMYTLNLQIKKLERQKKLRLRTINLN